MKIIVSFLCGVLCTAFFGRYIESKKTQSKPERIVAESVPAVEPMPESPVTPDVPVNQPMVDTESLSQSSNIDGDEIILSEREYRMFSHIVELQKRLEISENYNESLTRIIEAGSSYAPSHSRSSSSSLTSSFEVNSSQSPSRQSYSEITPVYNTTRSTYIPSSTHTAPSTSSSYTTSSSYYINPNSNPNTVEVSGYYRKDGTYVQPHTRTAPNHTITDNFSY